jgi:hypothetical protein
VEEHRKTASKPKSGQIIFLKILSGNALGDRIEGDRWGRQRTGFCEGSQGTYLKGVSDHEGDSLQGSRRKFQMKRIVVCRQEQYLMDHIRETASLEPGAERSMWLKESSEKLAGENQV